MRWRNSAVFFAKLFVFQRLYRGLEGVDLRDEEGMMRLMARSLLRYLRKDLASYH